MKQIKVWFVQKWFDDGMFSGRWEWVEDATSEEQAVKRAKQLKRQGKGLHRANYRIETIKTR